MLDQFLGYEDILMSNIKQLAEKEDHKGRNYYCFSFLIKY